MKLTNKKNLPEALLQLLTYKDRPREEGVYYVTELINSPKQVELRRRHKDEIEEDASSKIWALMGNAVHSIIEKQSGENRFKEERLVVEFPELNRKVVGRPDIVEEKNGKLILTDWKITSVWAYIYKSALKDWTEQLNIYDYMWHKYGFEISELQVVTILRDWSKGKSKQTDDYPDVQVQVVKIKKWTHEEQEKFIKERIEKLIKAEQLKDNELPECSDTERWAKEDVYPVMKKGRKSAVKLCKTKEEAEVYKQTYSDAHPNDKIEVGFRKGLDMKCDEYCSVCQFCNYWKKNHNKEE